MGWDSGRSQELRIETYACDLSMFHDCWHVKAHSGPITSLAFSGSGQRLLSSCRDNTLVAWDLKEQWGGHMDNDGDTVADHLPVNFKQIHEFHPVENDGVEGISCCALDPRGAIAVAACLTGRVMIWDMSDGHLINAIR